ncbi:MAG TPA: glycosyltransferase family 2 protein [Bryobacteraceae bacterium]|nr:glycosyltransferase family 2 protein [Bryobacteraceae bacterium]
MVREPGPTEAQPTVTVVVPTLAADETLTACLDSLRVQTFRDFEIIVVDNSGRNAVGQREGVRVIANKNNVGFGAAFNQAFHASTAPFLAILNDDATAHPLWLESLLKAVEERPDVGMCASRVLLANDGRLDSSGMLLCADGSSKQRGHLESPEAHARLQEVLLPSGSAAFYRREMLQEIGLFDESFFLYCEDTDLGLRGRWAAWECLYVPDAVVEHRYSHSAGKASALKAYYVERNRLFLAVKNLPLPDLLLAPFFSVARYFWHLVYALEGRGKAADFQQSGGSALQLPWIVLRAHLALLAHLPGLWKKRRARKQRFTSKQFHRLIRRFSISPRQVAAL